jgi:DNA-directed RNA polymerase subunit RPC12/RpoP
VKSVKIAIIVIALGSALVITLKMGGGEDAKQAVAEESRTSWLCGDCSHQLQLTALEVAEKMKVDGGAPLTCPQCSAKKVYRSLICDKCSTPYFSREVEGSSGVCPKCNPEAKPPPPGAEDELPPGAEPDPPEEEQEGAQPIKRPKLKGY